MFSSALIYALLGGIVPALLWLLFWIREDKLHPEPRWLLFVSFIAGMASVYAAIHAEKATADLFTSTSWRFTLWAGLEELVKLITVAIVALNSSYNDEPIDAMIYSITVALGFSALENTLFIFTPISQGFVAQSIATESMRFVGATLVHVVSSATIGFFIGYSMKKALRIRFVSILIGYLAALAIHAAFNLSIVDAEPSGIMRIFMWIWAAVVILIILFEEIKARGTIEVTNV